MKCLYEFKTGHDFIVFAKYYMNSNWRIEKELLRRRAEKYSNQYFFVDLKNRFYSKSLSIWDLKEEEVITWIDTIVIMSRMLEEMEKKGINLDEVCILKEYVIPYGNHMRSDYILIIRKTIIILELGMFNQDEKRSEERYSKKLHETIAYRQVLSNQMPKEIKVFNYVVIYKPEYDNMQNIVLSKNMEYNYKEILNATEYVLQVYENEIRKDGYYYISKLI